MRTIEEAVELLQKLKRDLMHARHFQSDTLAAMLACSYAEVDIEEFLAEHKGIDLS